ncbi:phage tail tape measure protein [Marinobacter subterrani]|uniref:Phage tail tape measure protein, TP901 family, core region n=1 Tax=Marinobacter subterrani TaxID=1658765 RepID=A0A0J7JBQ5_9GAMM|nr:phage tail tape measure protein [Marinobacter subterrani]KMQ73849.1 phage tail tape measure protein, TP901 family, core region [Marinobacter subterrani]KMQ75324.1 phage tail tape measure protein, TP901 family, core region [Marinobacter subterrani]
MSELRASVVMNLRGNLERNARRYEGSMRQLATNGSRHMSRLQRVTSGLGRTLESLGGRYTAMLGGAAAGYAGVRLAVESAKLDKQLIQIRQTAGATVEQSQLLRAELHRMSEETGQSLGSLLNGFNSLIQAGQSWEQALATIMAINPAMAVTGSNAEVLASAVGVAGEAFKFDLSNPKTALALIDQMTKAGRLGNAELEDLSSIFARVGVNAKSAGLEFADTLGFIEQLSMIERNPERLATLVDSTLRLFTNSKYMERAQNATGVSFYNAEGDRRAAFDVLDDIASRYQELETDQQRAGAIEAAFGNADLDTIKGLRTLLSGDAIAGARTKTRDILNSAGTISRDLEEALSNSVDQVARLKNALSGAADEFAKPINEAVENAVKYLLDEQNLSGKEMIGGGLAAAAGGLALAKGGGKLLQRFGGLGTGVAVGKALEEASGVQPVYVVNMPGGGFGAGADARGGAGGSRGNRRRANRVSNWRMARRAPSLRMLPTAGLGVMGTAGLAVGAAGAAGYGVGSLVSNKLLTDQGMLGTETGRNIGEAIGESVARVLAAFGNDEAQRAIRYNEGRGESTVRIQIDQDGRVRGATPEKGPGGPDLDVDSGAWGIWP